MLWVSASSLFDQLERFAAMYRDPVSWHCCHFGDAAVCLWRDSCGMLDGCTDTGGMSSYALRGLPWCLEVWVEGRHTTRFCVLCLRPEGTAEAAFPSLSVSAFRAPTRDLVVKGVTVTSFAGIIGLLPFWSHSPKGSYCFLAARCVHHVEATPSELSQECRALLPGPPKVSSLQGMPEAHAEANAAAECCDVSARAVLHMPDRPATACATMDVLLAFLEQVSESIQTSVRSLLLLYLFACVHLVSRATTLQKKSQVYNKGIRACRSIFRGAPTVLAIGAVAYLLPVCAGVRHTTEALADTTPLPDTSDCPGTRLEPSRIVMHPLLLLSHQVGLLLIIMIPGSAPGFTCIKPRTLMLTFG